jgi:hypothetical protein
LCRLTRLARWNLLSTLSCTHTHLQALLDIGQDLGHVELGLHHQVCHGARRERQLRQRAHALLRPSGGAAPPSVCVREWWCRQCCWWCMLSIQQGQQQLAFLATGLGSAPVVVHTLFTSAARLSASSACDRGTVVQRVGAAASVTVGVCRAPGCSQHGRTTDPARSPPPLFWWLVVHAHDPPAPAAP